MKGGEALAQLLKNVQGKRSTGGDSTNTLVVGFLVVCVVAIFVGTFFMVKSLKTEQSPVVVATPAVEKTSTDAPDNSQLPITQQLGLGTQQNPLVQTQADSQSPYIKSPLSGNPLFNQSTQNSDPLDPYSKMQQIGTMWFLGPTDIDALGDSQLAYGDAKPETSFRYKQQFLLIGKRLRGNWFYYLSTTNKNAPTIPLIVNGRDCGNPNSTGCQELFENSYYKVDPKMQLYLQSMSDYIQSSEDKNPANNILNQTNIKHLRMRPYLKTLTANF